MTFNLNLNLESTWNLKIAEVYGKQKYVWHFLNFYYFLIEFTEVALVNNII